MSTNKSLRRPTVRLLFIAGLVVISWLAREKARNGGEPDPGGVTEVEQLFAQGASDQVVQVEGVVARLLADDDEGSRHQRFILRLESGHTLLVAHNIDLSSRLSLQRGDRVEARGEYEWNDRGGVLHWTHRDPQGRHEDGWIQHEGRRYD